MSKDVADRPRPRLAARLARSMIGLGTWATLAGTLAAWGLLRAGDQWGPATFLMFGPRWLFVVPPAILLLAAVLFRRRSVIPLLAALVVAMWPVMGFNVPWNSKSSLPLEGPRLRVLTCNMHYGAGNLTSLRDLIASSRPDVVALQEWPQEVQANAVFADNWHVDVGEALFLSSRYPIRRVEHLGDDSTGEHGSVALYEIETPSGIVSVFSLHLASPRAVLKGAARVGFAGLADLEANSAVRQRQSKYIASAASRVNGPLLLVGDFNTPLESSLFRKVWNDYTNAFSDAGWGFGSTFENKWTRVRIDHLLIGGRGRATSCWVGPDVGSPHKPVFAEVSWPVSGTGPTQAIRRIPQGEK